MKSKIILGNTIEKLLSKYPLDKLTVKKILDESKVSKQTFYRNFDDKYSLANWQFLKVFFEASSKITPEMDFEQCVNCIYDGFAGKIPYLKNMFSSSDYNNLKSFIVFHMKSYFHRILEANGYDISDNKLILLCDTWIYGLIEITTRWVLSNCDEPRNDVISAFNEIMPKCIKDCFDSGNYFVSHPEY